MMKLRENVRYTDYERRLFATLQRRKEWTISKLACSVYGDDLPYTANEVVRKYLRRLERKFRKNREPFRICKSEPAGPQEITIWLEGKE